MKEIDEMVEKDSYLDTFCVFLNKFLSQHPETKDLWDDILYGTITPLGMLTHLYGTNLENIHHIEFQVYNKNTLYFGAFDNESDTLDNSDGLMTWEIGIKGVSTISIETLNSLLQLLLFKIIIDKVITILDFENITDIKAQDLLQRLSTKTLQVNKEKQDLIHLVCRVKKCE